MKITFLGATRTVTGSNFLVEAAGKKFLVDCGMWQGKKEMEEENFNEFDFDPKQIDFMLLTHAHIDHSGRIPKLYNEGFRNKIYAHKATCDLCSLMLPDSGHIQEMESEWKNRKRKRRGEPERPPLYTAEEAARCLEIFEAVNYDEIIEIDENIHVRFNDAGHMLGSSIIELWVKEDGKEVKTVFTGDLGNNDIPLLDSPTMIEDADYLVMESTYGSRLHVRNDEKAKIFLDVVSETLDKQGTVVIPSFAVGRTQEILYELNKIKENTDDEDFKRTLVNLYQAGGKTQAALCQEYGIAPMTLSRWIKQYSIVTTDDGEVLTAKQVKELQKRNAQLEEELLILKKAIAIFTPHSNND